MYERRITRSNPGCILFVLDQSGSMNGSFAGDPATSNAVAAADLVNKLILETLFRCQVEPGKPYHLFDLGVIGYGAGGARAGLRGALQDRGLIPVAELRESHLRIEERIRKVGDGADGPAEWKERLPVWLDPVAENGAPMTEALLLAGQILEPWVASHWDSFPPLVILINGGEPDAGPFEAAERLKSLSTGDGHLLLYSSYFPTSAVRARPFPTTAGSLPDGMAKALFGMSSLIPEPTLEILEEDGHTVEPGARGFAVNNDITPLVHALDVGTRVRVRD